MADQRSHGPLLQRPRAIVQRGQAFGQLLELGAIGLGQGAQASGLFPLLHRFGRCQQVGQFARAAGRELAGLAADELVVDLAARLVIVCVQGLVALRHGDAQVGEVTAHAVGQLLRQQAQLAGDDLQHLVHLLEGARIMALGDLLDDGVRSITGAQPLDVFDGQVSRFGQFGQHARHRPQARLVRIVLAQGVVGRMEVVQRLAERPFANLCIGRARCVGLPLQLGERPGLGGALFAQAGEVLTRFLQRTCHRVMAGTQRVEGERRSPEASRRPGRVDSMRSIAPFTAE